MKQRIEGEAEIEGHRDRWKRSEKEGIRDETPRDRNIDGNKRIKKKKWETERKEG